MQRSVQEFLGCRFSQVEQPGACSLAGLSGLKMDADPEPVLAIRIPEARFQLDIGAPMVFLQRAKLVQSSCTSCTCD